MDIKWNSPFDPFFTLKFKLKGKSYKKIIFRKLILANFWFFFSKKKFLQKFSTINLSDHWPFRLTTFQTNNLSDHWPFRLMTWTTHLCRYEYNNFIAGDASHPCLLCDAKSPHVTVLLLLFFCWFWENSHKIWHTLFTVNSPDICPLDMIEGR